MELTFGGWRSQMLSAGAELGVFGLLRAQAPIGLLEEEGLANREIGIITGVFA